MNHDAAPELAPPPAPAEPPSPTTRLMALEAMLFASPTPVKVSELMEATGWEKPMVERDLDQLAEVLLGRGIELQRIAGAMRLVTAPSVARYVERLIGVQTKRRLTRAQLETLAVVAYRQPVTRATVEALRGVSSDRVLGQLCELRLVREVGRAELPGRPLLYGTTADFLRYFGIDDLRHLPDIAQLKPKAPQVSASQAQFNAAARGEEAPVEEEAEVSEEETIHKLGAMQPLAAELSQEPSGSLRKLLAKIRGKAPK